MNTYCYKIKFDKILPEIFIKKHLSPFATEIIISKDYTVFVETRFAWAHEIFLNVLSQMSSVSKMTVISVVQDSIPFSTVLYELADGTITSAIELDPNDPETYLAGCFAARLSPATILHGISIKSIDYPVSKVMHLIAEQELITEEEIQSIGSTRIGVCATFLAENDDLDGAIMLSKLQKTKFQ